MAFVNRKQFSRIFENSNIADKLRNGALDGILLRDSGYACRAYLLTPILNPKNAGDVRYNTAHRRTRCAIERCFGLLKRRFPCLQLGLRTALANTLVIIVATAVLHNFGLKHREQDFDEDFRESFKLTVFLELRSRKTVRFSEHIMSADKYPSIFSRQMKAIV